MHMRIRRKLLFFSIILLVAFLIIARLTGMYQVYTLPTSSMEPSLQLNQVTLFSNLKTPKRNDVIAFTRRVNELYETDPNGKKIVNCFRLIAKGGDTLQIKNGYAYINGRLADDTTQLKFSYGLSGKDFNSLITALEIDIEKDNSGNFHRMGDTAYANLSARQYDMIKNVISLKKQINFMIPLPGIYQGIEWTIDDFGPYLVPPDHLFVMGDNRHNAMDSRFYGPISVKDYKGVLIAKF